MRQPRGLDTHVARLAEVAGWHRDREIDDDVRIARRGDLEPDLVDVTLSFDDGERPAAIDRRTCGRAERVELARELLRVAEREHVLDAADMHGRAGDHAA